MKTFNQPKPVFAEHGKRAVILFHAYSGSPNDVRMLCRSLEQKTTRFIHRCLLDMVHRIQMIS